MREEEGKKVYLQSRLLKRTEHKTIFVCGFCTPQKKTAAAILWGKREGVLISGLRVNYDCVMYLNLMTGVGGRGLPLAAGHRLRS